MLLSNDLAALIGFACESVLWGVNCTLWLTALVILRRRRFHENVYNPVIYLTSFIFLCCTAHFALEFNHFYTTLNAIGVQHYANETTQLSGADFLISVTDFLGDLTLIYRCWMLWGKNYAIIVLPLLTTVGGLASIIGVIVLLYNINPSSPAPPPVLVPLGLAAYALPLCTNVIVTYLIVFRIWASTRTPSGSPLRIGQGASRHAMMLIVESGALYLLFQLIFVILFAIQSTAEAIVAVMAVQIYGIAPTLIIIRVGLGISSEQTSGTVVSTRIKWLVRRGEESDTSATGFTDGLGATTDYEGAKESHASTPERDAEKAVQFVGSRHTDGSTLVM